MCEFYKYGKNRQSVQINKIQWNSPYFVNEVRKTTVYCVIYSETITVLKEYNIKGMFIMILNIHKIIRNIQETWERRVSEERVKMVSNAT